MSRCSDQWRNSTRSFLLKIKGFATRIHPKSPHSVVRLMSKTLQLQHICLCLEGWRKVTECIIFQCNFKVLILYSKIYILGFKLTILQREINYNVWKLYIQYMKYNMLLFRYYVETFAYNHSKSFKDLPFFRSKSSMKG